MKITITAIDATVAVAGWLVAQQPPPPPPPQTGAPPMALTLSNGAAPASAVATNSGSFGAPDLSGGTNQVLNGTNQMPWANEPPPPGDTNQVLTTTNQVTMPAVAPIAPPIVVEATATRLGDNELRLNFRNAPLDLVLSQLSEAAGFIIDLRTPVRGTVDIIAAQPVTKDEAVDLLNSMLNKNGYAAIRNERKLTIVSKTDAIHLDIPVKTGNKPEDIPKNDEIVTQIIPIRFVEATQLVKDLSPLVSPQATIMANEAGNSIALTDTQANIHHMVEIIKAIDSSAEDETQLRVFPLKYADPNEMASLLSGLFPDQGSSGSSAPVRFGGAPGGGGRFSSFMAAMAGGGAPGGGGGGAAAAQQRIKKRMQVVAVPDPRTSSVVVTANKDLMEQIAKVVEQLDFHSAKETTVQVFHLDNADPQELLPTLQDMFQGNNASRSSRTSSQNSPLMNRVQQNQNSTSSSGIGSGLGGGIGGGNRSGAPSF